MNRFLLPDDAIAILRRAVWQADAKRSYELMTGSFWWSDELVHEVSGLCVERDNWSFRYLMGYRGSLIRGTPEEAYRPVLHRERRRQCVALARLERKFRTKQGKIVSDQAPQQ